MKRWIWLLIACVWIMGCEQQEEAVIQTLTPAQVQTMLEQQSAILIDVRSEAEYEQQHIPNALNIPLDQLSRITDMIAFDEAVILYCRSGSRSAQAATQLRSMGYTNIYDLGGIQDWPYELVKP